MQRKTNYITIPVDEYERLTRSDAYLQAIINAPSFQRKEATEAIVEVMAKVGQATKAGADL
jgi:hypothetical protein